MKSSKLIILISFMGLFYSCKPKDTKLTEIPNQEEEPVNWEELNLEGGLSYEILFQSGDSILAPNGKKVPSKENLDCNVLFSLNGEIADSATLFTSFETRDFNADLGSGGGGMLSSLVYENGSWNFVGVPVGVDYSTVGETVNNCGGKIAPNGKIWSAEEFYSLDKKELFEIFHDTSNIKGKSVTDNFGWMVEIDPVTKKATQKMTQFGRYSHEDALATIDGKAVFLSNDESPAVLFKFEANVPFDYSEGQLFAYSESKKWIALPMDYKSLLNCRKEAFKRGATLFTRHEWFTLVGNKLYITETGKDSTSYKAAMYLGGVLPSYYPKDTLIDDPYGRILVLDLSTDELSVELEGGKYGEYFFSNPDCITNYSKDGKDYLIINEDIIGIDRNRSFKNFYQNEVYKYDLQTKRLERLLVSAKGSETTGGIFDSKGNYFLNIQHPDASNKSQFNRSTLVLIKGIQE